MKKLLLVSMFQNVSHLLQRVMPDYKGKSVAYIPTASLAEEPGGWAALEKQNLEQMGLVVDEVEVSTAPYADIQRALQKNDLIYIAGGNTFFLLQALKQSGADRLIREEVHKGKPYIGESAGAIAAAPDIAYSSAMDDPGKAPGLQDYTGLHLTEWYPVPHRGNPEYGAAVEQIVAAYASTLDLKVIDDHQALFVEDSRVEVLK